MTFKHGVSVSEQSTSIVAPVLATAGLPVVVGTAPINQAVNQSYVNKPLLAYSKAEFVAAMGDSSDWSKFSLCEFAKSHFELYGASPVVFINVLDPTAHKTSVTASTITISVGVAKIAQLGVLLSSVVVKTDSTEDGKTLIKGTDYTIGFNDDGAVVITRITTSTDWATGQTTLSVKYDYLDTSKVDADDIIGGVDANGVYTGLELVNQVFPLFRLIPGQILAPGWSETATVAAVMKAKAASINGLFKAMAITDISTAAAGGADIYSEATAWKNTNSYTDPLQIVCWPKVKLGTSIYHLSTHVAGVICKTDAANDDIPFYSPSNKALQVTSSVVDAGTEVTLGPDRAAYLNGEGIVTAMNHIGGWKLWGNRTGAYPGVTDVKDCFIPVRRMFNWIGNSIILTYWQHVDDPMNKRLINTVVDSINIWLNGLTARGALLGGRVEFISSENPTTDLINGTVKFHIYLTPPTPAEDMQFTLEFDVNYLNTLFA